MQLNQLIYKNETNGNEAVPELYVDTVTTKPNEITKNTLFVFLRSDFFAVEKIADYIMAKNPCAILCDNEMDIASDTIKIIRCDNTRTLLPYIYSRFYKIDYEKLKFCAVTGTNGKTTTATMIYKILRSQNINAGFIGTGKILVNDERITDDNYSMTTPDPEILYYSIKLMETGGCEVIVMEVSSHALHYSKVLPIRFDISIFTNLSPEHLDFHKDINDYFQTKLKLFDQSKLGIFNVDDEYGRIAYGQASIKKTSFGIIENANATADVIQQKGFDGTDFEYRFNNDKINVKLKLCGIHNVYNASLAICAATSLGIDPREAGRAISSIEYIDGRLEIIKSKISVIIDYAHTDTALENTLKSIISNKNTEQNLITVFGCGGNRDRYKRPRMAAVAEKYSDQVIVTADNSRNEPLENIISDILKGFKNTAKRTVITSRKAAIEHAIYSAKDGDIIAVIGKGHERYNIDENGYSPFNEREIIREALKKRNEA